MTSPTEPATTEPLTPADDFRERELADEAKTADSAPAEVHPPRERKVLVRDAHGHDPYGGDRYRADGERDEVELGQSPYELPDPTAAALRKVKADADKA